MMPSPNLGKSVQCIDCLPHLKYVEISCGICSKCKENNKETKAYLCPKHYKRAIRWGKFYNRLKGNNYCMCDNCCWEEIGG